MCACFVAVDALKAFEVQVHEQPVAVGSASGVASSLILSILGNLARETPFEPVVHCLDTPSGINWRKFLGQFFWLES